MKVPAKRQCSTIKQTFFKNYDDTDNNYNSAPSPEIEVETWTSKKETKKKKNRFFLSPPVTPIYFTKILHLAPAG